MKIKRKIELPFKKKSFVTCIAFDEKQMIYGITCSDNQIYFYLKGKVRIELLKVIEAPCLQQRIWYMQKAQVWLTAGRDFKLRWWDTDRLGSLKRTFDIHTDEITCCIEIKNPACIATCSLDRTIVMYDLANGEIIRRINENHDKGIFHLKYQSQNGATMVSIATEIYANVWSPESLVSDIHIGKLKGHKKSIVAGDYLNRAPFFATIDILNMVIIWDIKNLTAA